MDKYADWPIQNVSVVLVAESPIEPKSIGAILLKEKSVTQPGWIAVSEISTPVFAETLYINGIRIRTEGNRCIFQQEISEDLPVEREVYQLAMKYVSATELAVPYQAVGINWTLTNQPSQDCNQLLHSMLKTDQDLSGFIPASISLTKNLNGRTCNLNITANQSTVSVNVNYHHQVPEHKAKEIIENWHECQKHLEEEIISVVLHCSEA